MIALYIEPSSAVLALLVETALFSIALTAYVFGAVVPVVPVVEEVVVDVVEDVVVGSGGIRLA